MAIKDGEIVERSGSDDRRPSGTVNGCDTCPPRLRRMFDQQKPPRSVQNRISWLVVDEIS